MKRFTTVLSLFLLSGLLACGGGGGGSPDPVNQDPMAVASNNFSVVEETAVTLDGSGSADQDGSITSYAWSQTGGSPAVTLTNASSATASFMAPAVTTDTLLTFTLTVTDNDGATDTDSVDVTVTPDQAPVVTVPADFSAVENATVPLDGSASSDDVAIASYLWEQTDGETVTLSDATSATASFTAPAFDPAQAKVLTFQLTVTDSVGQSTSDSVAVTIVDTAPIITLSGQITFDLVPHNTSTNGLNHTATSQEPVRGATVELLDSGATTIIDTTTSDSDGNYSFVVTPQTDYVVRVKAEMKQSGTPSWDFTVVDNTNSQALYSMDSAVQSVGAQSVTLNINADSGWTGAGYGNPRIAAPFAILKSVYQAKEKVLSVDNDVEMPALKLNWSTGNVAVSGDESLGQIGTSHWNGTEAYILGDANGDTDEYDGHVIIHEWGHYFEDKFSRADSIGGPHSQGDKLDMRVALGEGFGNALSGIVTDDPFYRDSFGNNQSQGFDIPLEQNPATNLGWYSEYSVLSLLYDMYDSTNETNDNLSLGFAPIYAALLNGEKDTEAMTSIFSLANQIKAEAPASANEIDNLLATQNIIVADDFGSTETNNGGDNRNLPVYASISVGGGPVEICSYNTNGQYNKLGARKFLELDVATSGTFTFTATGQSAGDDPDFVVYQRGVRQFISQADGDESTSQTLAAGKYVIEVYEFSNADPNGSGKDTCIDIAIN